MISPKYSILSLFLLVSFASCDNTSKWKPNQETMNQPEVVEKISSYARRVARHRDSTSTMFLSGANGVLPKEDLSNTRKLDYFTPDTRYRLPATFEPIENGEIIKMETSTDRLPEYKRYGVLKFNLGDSVLQLTIYQNVEQPEYLFCPFKDLTNTKSTYGAGRYLDFKMADLANPVLDFNYAYNPYCAYNKEYSCPIPPLENHLKVPIEAGEKKWH